MNHAGEWSGSTYGLIVLGDIYEPVSLLEGVAFTRFRRGRSGRLCSPSPAMNLLEEERQ